ncbi:hypothetical protein ACHHRT_11130 [Desulfurivibrio sp. D14AmB]|uniref:hypothetical protein n=1 Tax=Desulfurivibrio sp. D14AmB TaxID=3374370 RepID=UPI00376EFB64
MYLIVGSTPFCNWERVLPLLQRAGCACPAATRLEKWRSGAKGGAANAAFREACAELLNGCESPSVLAVDPFPLNGVPLDFWVGEFADTHLLLLHSRPERLLAQAMAENREPKELLEQWQSAAKKLLQYYRRNRARATLIDVDCALAAPELFSQACHDYLGLKNAPANSESHPKSSAVATRSDIYQLIAQQMVAQSPELNDLLAELEAGSLPLGELPLPYWDCQRLYDDYRNLLDQLEQVSKSKVEQGELLQRAESRRKELEEENELLLLQLHQVQEELENRYLQLKQLEDSRSDKEELQQQYESKVKQLESERAKQAKLLAEQQSKLEQVSKSKVEQGELLQRAESRRKELEEENELLLLQLHQVQEELERYYMQLQEEKEDFGRREKKLKALERKISYMENSKSWKITRPLRGVIKPFMKKTVEDKPA